MLKKCRIVRFRIEELPMKVRLCDAHETELRTLSSVTEIVAYDKERSSQCHMCSVETEYTAEAMLRLHNSAGGS